MAPRTLDQRVGIPTRRDAGAVLSVAGERRAVGQDASAPRAIQDERPEAMLERVGGIRALQSLDGFP